MTKDNPSLSDMPIPLNAFAARDGLRSTHPLAVALDGIGGDSILNTYAAVQLLLPLGCPFSIFMVRGYPRGDDFPCLEATLTISRDLAQELAKNLNQAEILEWKIVPPGEP